MLATKHRFHRRNHVRYVYRAGKNVRGQLMSLKYVSGQRHNSFRVAVVVSKKVSKKAVVRNRIRRRIYELLRKHSQEIPAGTDMILTIFNDTVADIPAQDLEDLVLGLVSKIQKK